MSIEPKKTKVGQLYIGESSKAFYFIMKRLPKGVRVLKAAPQFEINEIDNWNSMRRRLEITNKSIDKRTLIVLVLTKRTLARE